MKKNYTYVLILFIFQNITIAQNNWELIGTIGGSKVTSEQRLISYSIGQASASLVQNQSNGTQGFQFIPYKMNTAQNDPILNNVNILPNPASDYLKIESIDNIELLISIFNLTGMPFITNQLINSNSNVDVSALSTGTYYLMIKHQLNTKIFKLIIF